MNTDLMAPLVWRTSSHSTANGNCVEVAPVVDGVLLRDSKDRSGGTLAIPGTAWTAFVGATAGARPRWVTAASGPSAC